jgi:L-asparaginase
MMTDYRPPWLPATRIYCDFQEKTVTGVAALLARKLPLHSDTLPVSFLSRSDFRHQLVITKKETAHRPRILIINTGGSISVFSKEGSKRGQAASWDEFILHAPFLEKQLYGVDMIAFSPTFDSSDASFQHWVQIAQVIATHYHEYEGFVIFHGSDTLSYTATALSFMLCNLAKPVVLTSAAVPAFNNRSDAIQNIAFSTEVAAHNHPSIPLISEVCVLSSDSLLRGNRTRAISASSFRMFDSPNYPPLGMVTNDKIYINSSLLLRPDKSKGFYIDVNFNLRVMVLEIFPGISGQLLQHLTAWNEGDEKKLEGIVLIIYGAGNVPTQSWFVKWIDECISRGIALVAASRSNGGLRSMFEAESTIFSQGVINGLDMTIECAFVKLSWLLGKTPLSEIKELMESSLRGEVTN